MAQAKPSQLPARPASGVNYQSGYNADSQAVNSGSIKQNFLKDSLLAPKVKSKDGQRAVEDVQRGMQAQAVAQMDRGLQSQNAQQAMADQANRSELMQQGLTNQAQIYQDMNQRSIDQIGLAGRLNEAMIRNKFALLEQGLQKTKQRIGSMNSTQAGKYLNNLMK